MPVIVSFQFSGIISIIEASRFLAYTVLLDSTPTLQMLSLLGTVTTFLVDWLYNVCCINIVEYDNTSESHGHQLITLFLLP